MALSQVSWLNKKKTSTGFLIYFRYKDASNPKKLGNTQKLSSGSSLQQNLRL
jgi:hypothetical protein